MPHGAMGLLQPRRTSPMADRGTIMNVVSWILLAVVVCTLIARFAMKLSIRKKGNRLGLDDLFIVLAALFSFGQTVAVSIESIHALGQHTRDLDDEQKLIFSKAEYAGCMLYIANMGCARISLCILIKKILPGSIPNYTALVFAGFTALWTISGVFVNAFPCELPDPWKVSPTKKCFNLTKFINYIGVTNIVVEILLVMIPLFVWNIRLTAGRRVSVSCAFLSRLSIVAAVSAQLYFFNHYGLSPDYTYDYWETVLCVQVAQNLSVITACLPCLHPFIVSILAGTTKPETLVFNCDGKKSFCDYFRKKNFKFDPTSSQSSTMPIKQEVDYCRPLATYGLDRSSAHLHSQHFNRFPANAAQPIQGPSQPENVFMRSVEIPPSRPGNASTSKELPPPPKNLDDVGVLPMIDWETDSSDRGSGRSSPSRRPNSEYVFNRAKVISVPEENHLAEDGDWKKFSPPLPSPKMPTKRPS